MRVSQPLPTLVAEFREDGRTKRMLLVAPDGAPRGRPIFPFEVVGIFDPESPPPYSGPNGFRQNGTFLHFLHWVISVDAPTLPDAREAALSIGEGLLQVLDGRAEITDQDQGVPDEEVLGSFEVKDGEIVPGSYRSTFTHKPLTDRGLFELSPALCEKVLERMAAQVAIELARKNDA